MSLIEMSALIGAVTVIAGAVWWCVRKIRRGWRIYGDWRLRVNKAFTELDKLVEQFQPNGGTSVRDAIDRIDFSVQRNTARFIAMLNHEIRAVFECDVEGQCTFANKALSDLFGMADDELMGNGWLVGIDPADRERIWQVWLSCVKSHIPYEAVYSVRNQRTNVKQLVRAYSMAMKNLKGNIIGFHGVVEPITQEA